MPDEITIKLGAKDYKIRRLTLRQARALGIGVVKDSTTKTSEDIFVGSVDQSVSTIAMALARDHPEITEAAILDMELSVREVRNAADEILIFAGYLKRAEPPAEGDKPGEAVPGAA
jgi:hypothetical protein